MSSHSDNIHDDCECSHVRDKVDEIHRILTGASEPSRGVVVRLDRLEQSESRRNFWTTTAVGAALTAIIGTLSQSFHWGNKP